MKGEEKFQFPTPALPGSGLTGLRRSAPNSQPSSPLRTAGWLPDNGERRLPFARRQGSERPNPWRPGPNLRSAVKSPRRSGAPASGHGAFQFLASMTAASVDSAATVGRTTLPHRPSPAGRGRIVRRLRCNWETERGAGTQEQLKADRSCSLSQRERVGVRENG